MATGGVDITEYITCGVCREVYRDPYALQCLHTFCKGCIDGMEEHRMVRCPLCQEKMVRMEGVILVVLICGSHHHASSGVQGTYENLSFQLLEEKMQKMETKMETKIEALTKENHELHSKVTLMEKRLENVQSENRNRPNSTFVSFLAYPSETKSYTSGEHVMFDVAIRNYGDAYNTEFSSFRCPVSGYYIFFVNLFTWSDERMYATVKIENGSEANLPLVYSPMIGTDNAASLSVTYCSEGELVWVEANNVDDNILHGGDSRSHFTGVLLYPE